MVWLRVFVPVGRARCGAARAQNALVQTIQQLTVLNTLEMFVLGLAGLLGSNILGVCLGSALQPGFDRLVPKLNKS